MPPENSPPLTNDAAERKHEPDEFWARMATSFGVGLLLLVVLVLIGISIAFRVVLPEAMSTHAGVIWQEQNLDPGVEPNQAYQQERLRAEEEAFLRQYAWEDESRGIARIPISRGIELMAERQLKATWPASAAESSYEQETQ